MHTALLIIDVLLALSVIGLVLVQQGKGADAGAAFGSGASGTVFGAGGSGSFLTRLTTALATLFFVTSLGLAIMAAHRTDQPSSIMDQPAASQSSQSSQSSQAGKAAAGETGGQGNQSDTGTSKSGSPTVPSGDMPSDTNSGQSGRTSGKDDLPPTDQ